MVDGSHKRAVRLACLFGLDMASDPMSSIGQTHARWEHARLYQHLQSEFFKWHGVKVHPHKQHAICDKRHHAWQGVHVTDRILLHERPQALKRDLVLAAKDAIHCLAQSRNAIMGAPMLVSNDINNVTNETDTHVVPVNER